MSDDDKTKDLHEVQIPKEQGERLTELGQRVMSPPPLDQTIQNDATKGQRVLPPPPIILSPETTQAPTISIPSSQETPQTLPTPTPAPQPPQQTSSPSSSEDTKN